MRSVSILTSRPISTTFLNVSVFKVWANYVYLDTEERRRFAQKGHEYLIEQVQHTGTDTVDAFSTPSRSVSRTTTPSRSSCGASPTPPRSLPCGTSPRRTLSLILLSSLTRLPTALTPTASCPSPTSAPPCTPPSSPPRLTPRRLSGQLETFKLVLNGQDRFKEQKGKYFNQVQAYNHHSGCPAPGVYSYSFALKPEEHQPTGTCNFSRIDNAQVAVKMAAGTATSMHMFATNYNVLRIQSGMGGLAFSN
jgi:hypothetical protein